MRIHVMLTAAAATALLTVAGCSGGTSDNASGGGSSSKAPSSSAAPTGGSGSQGGQQKPKPKPKAQPTKKPVGGVDKKKDTPAVVPLPKKPPQGQNVEFRVQGTGSPDVSWITDTGSHSGNDKTDPYGFGSTTLPWTATTKVDEKALYYAVNAQLGQDGGSISCQIKIGDEIVANGTADGAFQICSAQANSDFMGGFS